MRPFDRLPLAKRRTLHEVSGRMIHTANRSSVCFRVQYYITLWLGASALLGLIDMSQRPYGMAENMANGLLSQVPPRALGRVSSSRLTRS